MSTGDESFIIICQIRRFVKVQYYTDGDVSNSFITEIIKQAGGSNQDSVSQNIFAQIIKMELERVDYTIILISLTSSGSDTGPISSVRTTLETMPQEESQLDWRVYSRILQCKSRPPQPSFIDESQIIIQCNQELQLATEEGSVQSNPTSVLSNPDGSVRISPELSNVQLLNNKNECTPPRLASMEAMSGLPTTHSFAFYPEEDEPIQFEEDQHLGIR
ncbi:hypothetical protein ACTFIW_003273 [Dictyostelium discoideum]